MPRKCSRCGLEGHDRRGCDVPAPAWAQALQARPAWAQALQASDEVHAPARATAAHAELETERELWPSDVVACLQAIDAALRIPLPQPGDYVELLDEDDEYGLVVFRRKDGTPTMFMPRADYEALARECSVGGRR